MIIEGVVDTSKAHIKITYGDIRKNRELILVALVGPVKGEKHRFVVHYVEERQKVSDEMIEAVRKELNFYMVEKGEPDPWKYAIYHCGTAANLYSDVHWGYYPKGGTEST